MNSPTRTLLAIGAAVVAVAIAAQASMPLTIVPQTLQSLAVVLVGAWLGPVRGGIALVLYIAIGAVGAPVFANGASGVDHLSGMTAGYLAGFVVAAVGMGWWVRQPWSQRFPVVFGGALLAHAVILAFGGMRLSATLGTTIAIATGMLPFLLGSVVKSLVAAGLWVYVPRAALEEFLGDGAEEEWSAGEDPV